MTETTVHVDKSSGPSAHMFLLYQWGWEKQGAGSSRKEAKGSFWASTV